MELLVYTIPPLIVLCWTSMLCCVFTDDLRKNRMDAKTKSFCVQLVQNKVVLYVIMVLMAPLMIIGALMTVLGFALTSLGIGMTFVGYAGWFIDTWVPNSVEFMTSLGPEIRTCMLNCHTAFIEKCTKEHIINLARELQEHEENQESKSEKGCREQMEHIQET